MHFKDGVSLTKNLLNRKKNQASDILKKVNAEKAEIAKLKDQLAVSTVKSKSARSHLEEEQQAVEEARK